MKRYALFLLIIVLGCLSCLETGVRSQHVDPPLFTMQCYRGNNILYCAEDVDVDLIAGFLKIYYFTDPKSLEPELYLCGENLHLESGTLWLDTLVNNTMGDTYACANISPNSALIYWEWISHEVLFIEWENHYLELMVPRCNNNDTCNILGEVRYYTTE